MWWPFGKKYSLSDSGFLEGMTDWHSHILPSVDDGIKYMADSLKILDFYEKEGVSEVWFTPHIMADTPNETEFLISKFEKFQAMYKGSVKLHLGAEHMIDRLFNQRLDEDDLLPYDDKCLLVETSYLNPPLDLWETLERIRSKGYYPVLAHPERYVYMEEEDYKRLRRMDVEFQLNLPSIVGQYGREVQHKAIYLLKNDYYQRCGSDVHRFETMESYYNKPVIPEDILKALEESIVI